MIISRTPCRVCLAGGGTDVGDFYRREDYGAAVTCAVAPYVYITVTRRPGARLRVLGLADEDCAHPTEVQHPLVREALLATGAGPGLEIWAHSEVPPGSGLASSSALAVGLLHALGQHRLEAPGGGTRSLPRLDPVALAEAASAIEINRLGGHVGKLDPYATALGGFLHLRFFPDETTTCTPLNVPGKALRQLEKQMMLFFTGRSRQASEVMAGWRRGMDLNRPLLRRFRDQAEELAVRLAAGEAGGLGPALDEAWQQKKRISGGISSPEIDAMYEAAIAAGATGGKLSGAGGGGFLMIMCPAERQEAVRLALSGYAELQVRLAGDGTRIVRAEAGQGEHMMAVATHPV